MWHKEYLNKKKKYLNDLNISNKYFALNYSVEDYNTKIHSILKYIIKYVIYNTFTNSIYNNIYYLYS